MNFVFSVFISVGEYFDGSLWKLRECNVHQKFLLGLSRNIYQLTSKVRSCDRPKNLAIQLLIFMIFIMENVRN